MAAIGLKVRSFKKGRPAKVLLSVWFLLALAVLVPLIAPKALATHDPLRIELKQKLQGPSAAHWMGTDQLGRDIYSRLVHGARTTLGVSLGAMAFAVLVGTTIGVYSGYAGGKADLLVQRLVDIMMTFPILLLAMVFVVAFGQTAVNVALAAGLALTFPIVRVIRGIVLTLRQSLFVEAARSYGCPDVRIMLRHVTPHVMGTALILGALQLSVAILTSSSLGFLGLGLPPPTPGWGEMLGGDARPFVLKNPWLGVFPGLVVTAAVLIANFAADALRDSLDPNARQRKQTGSAS